MTTWILLLRGVTPSGRNSLRMAALRDALEEAGLAEVRTYIQSGNVVARSALGRGELQELVHRVIAERFGGDIPVIARTPAELRAVMERNPFAGEEAKRQYFTLLAEHPSPERAATFEEMDWSPDRLQRADDVVYTLYATRASDSRYGNNYIERKLGVIATTRNFNTMTRLLEMAAA